MDTAGQSAADGQHMINLFSFLMVFGLMVAGAIAHWAKKRKCNEIRGSLFDYLFMDNPRRTGATGGSIVGAALLASGTGVADVIDPRLMWEMITHTASMPAISFFAIGAALQSGWQFDSMINKGGQP